MAKSHSWISLLAGSAVAFSLASASFAFAQVSDGISFTDPNAPIEETTAASVGVNVRHDQAARFTPSLHEAASETEGPRQLQLEIAATGENAGVPVDVSFARRATLGSDANGDLNRRGDGSEVRVGRGLVQSRDEGERRSSVYMFVASDDEALTWQPGQRGSVALQDQVEIGDVSAGVTYERGGLQASVAYVEREVSTQVGRDSYSQNESFAGVTLTLRN